MSRIMRFFVCTFLVILLAGTNAFAAGYYCAAEKTYTGCAAGYYLSDCGSVYDGRTIYITAVDNECISCPYGYECAGGAVCPVKHIYKVTLDNQGATTAGTTEYYYQYKIKDKCYYYTSSALSTCIGGTSGNTITVPQRTGYTFGGYYTGANGTGTQYVNQSGAAVNNLYSNHAGDITLYAKWTANTYTITYTAGGGTGTNMTQTVTYGQAFTPLANTFTKAQATFAYWHNSTDNNDDFKSPSQSYTYNLAKNITMEAYYNCNAGYYYGTNGVCTACAAGTYKDTLSNATSCTACPATSTHLPSFSDASLWPANTYTVSQFMALLFPSWVTGITSQANCRVYVRMNNERGTFYDDTMFYDAAKGVYRVSNPIYYDTIKPGYYAKTQYSASYCKNGSYMLYQDAVVCPAGYFCPGYRSSDYPCNGAETYPDEMAKYECPANSTSAAGASACTCNAGYSVDGTVNGATTTTTTACTKIKITPQFTATTTALAANTTFNFTIGAAGTFYVDWGDGSPIETITRTDTVESIYSHTYTKAGVRTIGFAGAATGYNTGDVAAIRFNDNTNIAEISGSLGAIFGTLGDDSAHQPKFIGTFRGTKITSIPAGLFSGVSGSAEAMFADTFSYTQITSIPAGLFSGVTGSATNLFASTFSGTQITSIPGSLFSGVSGAADGMFAGTFMGTKITSIPAGLFSGVSGSAINMFYGTFSGTKITSIPGSLFSGVSGSAINMFRGTFMSTNITSIPAGLFSGVSGAAEAMFYGTFRGTKITSLPASLFPNLSGAPASGMFDQMFANTPDLTGYIPVTLFENLTVTADAMPGIFSNSGLDTACPAGTYTYITGWEDQWDGHVACDPCAVGSYSNGTGNIACTACNNNGNWGKTTSGVGQTSCNATCPDATGVKGWVTSVWNTNNTVDDDCVPDSCVSGHYLDDGACPRCDSFANGLYPHSSNSGTTGGREACFVRRNELPGQYIVAGAETATDCPAGTYMGTTDETAVHYGEGYECNTCGADTYAAGTGNTSCTACLENYKTFGPKTSADACRISCPAGSYLATANATECTQVGAGYYAAASYVTQGNVGQRSQCPLGLTTIGYGVGADELGDCGRILHVGDGQLYLRGEKLTSPSLVVNIGGTNFYGNMSTDVNNMSDNIAKKLRINYGGVTYSVYDDSGAVFVPTDEH